MHVCMYVFIVYVYIYIHNHELDPVQGLYENDGRRLRIVLRHLPIPANTEGPKCKSCISLCVYIYI